MPKITRRHKPQELTEAEVAQAADAAWEEFEDGFQKSKRGNWWRHWEGKTVTVFERSDGFWGWCIADGESNRFSRGGYESDGEAMDALASELGVGVY